MDYIKGKLTILDAIKKAIPTDHAFFSAFGTPFPLSELATNLDKIQTDFTKININFMSGGLSVVFDTSTVIGGAYEAILYPKNYGEVQHIYSGESPFDLKDSWVYTTVTYDNVVYYLYCQDRKVKEKDMKYTFIFKAQLTDGDEISSATGGTNS